jgi:6-pyruvoyltetrahydropterin/6-carboxytetrahydropterin synthase
MSWSIDKQFSFCYGHRVYVQKLNQEYCGEDNKAKCRHLHGHEGLVHVHLQSSELNEQSMVTDFKHLGWLKIFIDDTIDHKFIIDYRDPMFTNLVSKIFFNNLISGGGNPLEFCESGVENFHTDMVNKLMLEFCEKITVLGTNHVVGQKIILDGIDHNSPEYETLEGYLIVDFVPTSENLSKWMYELVDAKMKLIGVNVSHIEWFETPKSRSIYRK